MSDQLPYNPPQHQDQYLQLPPDMSNLFSHTSPHLPQHHPLQPAPPGLYFPNPAYEVFHPMLPLSDPHLAHLANLFFGQQLGLHIIPPLDVVRAVRRFGILYGGQIDWMECGEYQDFLRATGQERRIQGDIIINEVVGGQGSFRLQGLENGSKLDPAFKTGHESLPGAAPGTRTRHTSTLASSQQGGTRTEYHSPPNTPGPATPYMDALLASIHDPPPPPTGEIGDFHVNSDWQLNTHVLETEMDEATYDQSAALRDDMARLRSQAQDAAGHNGLIESAAYACSHHIQGDQDRYDGWAS
jgi:hypothetical protein